MRTLFSENVSRFEEMSTRVENLIFDYSKNHIDQAGMKALIDLAEAADVKGRRDAMFSGDKINETEGRAVLHTALRNRSDDAVMVNGEDVMPDVRNGLGKMAEFADCVRSGEYELTGGSVTDVVNIGIGGSDLGPKMVTRALAPYADSPRVHFISNVDPADISDTLKSLDLSTTLFIVSSKSFTTRETMSNAQVAFDRVRQEVGSTASDHFCAVSTNLEATRAFGVPDERTFGFWDWVGGRYSVWSAIGLPVMMAIGPDAFNEFLDGAWHADRHFLESPLAENVPVILALLGIWNRNICGHNAQAILPYDNRMADFPRWLQQLDMESNGKRVSNDGEEIGHATSPVVFGEPGTNGQHAFYQMLHQGTDIIPCDFLVAVNGHEPDLEDQHQTLLANCLAQSEALMVGRTLEEADENTHRVFEGNRPSNTFLYKKLDPKTLGMLMALYEHKTFVQGVIWGVNSFDQFGVELGKELADDIEKQIQSGKTSQTENGSTQGLLDAVKSFQRS